MLHPQTTPATQMAHLMSATEELFRLPATLFIEWWNAVFDAWVPQCPACVAHDTFHLEMPGALDADRDHGLFA